MAARTSTQTGPWGDTATWGGNPAPGPADTATIAAAHTVSVSDARTVAGWTQQGTGVLAIAGAGSLTSTADTLTAGDSIAGAKVTIAAGGKLLWDPPAGATIIHKTGGAAYAKAVIQARGTAAARCTIGKAAGAAGSLLWRSDFLHLTGFIDAEFTDFDGFGDAANVGVQLPCSYDIIIRMHDCRVRGGGEWNLEIRETILGGAYTPGVCEFVDCTWNGTLGAQALTVNAIAGGYAAPAVVTRCDFDQQVTFAYFGGFESYLTLTDCVFRKLVAGTWPGAWVISSGHLFYQRSATAGATTLAGFHTDCYFLADLTDGATADPQYFVVDDDTTMDGAVYDYRGPVGDTGSCFTVVSGSGLLKRSIILPASNAGAAAGAARWQGGTGTFKAEHCTIYCPDGAGVRFPRGGTMSAGTIPALRSNLFWTDTVTPVGYGAVYDSGTQATDAVTPAGVTGNAFVGTGAGSNTVAGAAASLAGLSGLVLSVAPTGNQTLTMGGAQLADVTRNFLGWARGPRGHTGTDDVVRDLAMADIAADKTLIRTGLLSWVRAGFLPGAASLATAAHDGTTVGAVQATSGGALPALTNLAEWRSNIHDRHNSGPNPYLLGAPGDSWMNGSEHYDVILDIMHARDYCLHTNLPPLDWTTEISNALVRHRDNYVFGPGINGVAGHLRYTSGLCRHYYETGDPQDLQAITIQTSLPSNGTPQEYFDNTALEGMGREPAYYLKSGLDSLWLGLPYSPLIDTAAELGLEHIAQWTVPAGTRYIRFCKPFMAGLTMRSLIAYWDRWRGTADTGRAAIVAEIPPAIEACLAFLWAECWYPEGTPATLDGGEVWTKGALKYIQPSAYDPSIAPMEGLAIVSVQANNIFTGDASLSAIDDYYKYAYFQTEPIIEGYFSYVQSYNGATKQFTLFSPNNGPLGIVAGNTYRLYLAGAGPTATDGNGPSPDLNQMIAPAYAWAYWYRKQVLGDAAGALIHRQRHDGMFNGAFMADRPCNTQKTWNQALLWTTKGLDWRDRGDLEWPAATTFTLRPPANGAGGPAAVLSGPFRLEVAHGVTLDAPTVVTPTSSTGLGTFSPNTAVLTTDRPWALFRFTPHRDDDGTEVTISATAVGLPDPAAVAYAVRDAPPRSGLVRSVGLGRCGGNPLINGSLLVRVG